MSRVLVIPDVHLKPWMIDQAENILKSEKCDMAISLGDIVDDWGQEFNLDLYKTTIERCYTFAKENKNVLFCYGNHDVSYLWEQTETGYSEFARSIVLDCYNKFERYMENEGRLKMVHRIDNAIFSHAGITMEFIEMWFKSHDNDMDSIIASINDFGQLPLWMDCSPIWARPQYGHYIMYAPDYLQVVGHTPVEKPTLADNVLSLDTFSTYRDGMPIGDQRFVWVDTETKEWGYVEE